MWYQPAKHTYLQKVLCYDIHPRVVNRVIDRAMGWKTTYRNLEPPFLVISTQMPTVFNPNVDATRAKKAFGRWALPKLRREIHNPDILVVMQAMNTILDMVHDPEKGFEAIRLGVVDRLIDMICHEKPFVRERVCMILYTIASQAAGREAIMRREDLLINLSRLLTDSDPGVKLKANMVIEMLSRHWIGADALINAQYPVLLLKLLEEAAIDEANDEFIILQLKTLQMCLDRDVKVLCLQNNAMRIFKQHMMNPREDISGTAMHCIALLCQHPAGRAEADAKGILVQLVDKLYDERRFVHTKAALAIAFATITPAGRNRAMSLCIIERCMELMQDFHCAELQLMCSKILANLAEHPQGRAQLLKRRAQEKIMGTYSNHDTMVDKHLGILLDVIRWKP